MIAIVSYYLYSFVEIIGNFIALSKVSLLWKLLNVCLVTVWESWYRSIKILYSWQPSDQGMLVWHLLGSTMMWGAYGRNLCPSHRGGMSEQISVSSGIALALDGLLREVTLFLRFYPQPMTGWSGPGPQRTYLKILKQPSNPRAPYGVRWGCGWVNGSLPSSSSQSCLFPSPFIGVDPKSTP